MQAHSDGDIIFHAIADAILGAIAEGDIGDHFPDTDSKNLNLDSSFIVKDAIKSSIKGFVLNNLDITLLLEKPKIYEYKKDMIDNILKLLQIESTPDDVINQDMFNIKASTSESLGYMEAEGEVTCYCIASLRNIAREKNCL